MDDWGYSFVHGTDKRVETLSDIFISQYEHYFSWGGRSVVHVIAQTLLFIKRDYSIILNTSVFLLYIWLIYKFANRNKSTNAGLFIFIFTLTFLIQRVFFITFIWLTGSANYLWGTTIVLIFLYTYYSYFMDENKTDKEVWIKRVLFLCAGIIAGWCNENTSVCIFAILFGLCWLLKKNNRKIPGWYIAGIAGVLIGFFMMIKAPGNYVRYEVVMQNESIKDDLLAHVLYVRIPAMLRLYLQTLLLPLLGWVLLYLFQSKRKSHRVEIQFGLLLILAAHIGFLSMVAAPFFSKSAACSLITLEIIAIAIMYNITELNRQKLKFINKTTVLISLSILFIAYYSWRLKHTLFLHNEFKKRELLLTEQKNSHIKDVTFFSAITMPSEFRFTDISTDSTHWVNRLYATYNEINSVKLISEEKKK